MHSLIGLISDAHGNSLAFDRGVSLLLEQGADHLYFLGDAVGYVPSVAVLDSLAQLDNRVQCIRGNHEMMLIDGQVDPDRERAYQFEAIRETLTQQHLNMITTWPAFRREEIDGLTVLLVHGSPADPTCGYVYPDTDLTGFAPDADWVFMGNTHHPFVRMHDGTCYVNVGSCGMPRDDGRYGSAALFDVQSHRVSILRFDIAADTRKVLDQFPEIHPSVRDVYQRRKLKINGTIL